MVKNYFILKAISNNSRESLGTLELAKVINISPKCFIDNIKKLESNGYIHKHTIPVKPKGRKRVYITTFKGNSALYDLDRINHDLLEDLW